jgi:hypothetical protein
VIGAEVGDTLMLKVEQLINDQSPELRYTQESLGMMICVLFMQ